MNRRLKFLNATKTFDIQRIYLFVQDIPDNYIGILQNLIGSRNIKLYKI